MKNYLGAIEALKKIASYSHMVEGVYVLIFYLSDGCAAKSGASFPCKGLCSSSVQLSPDSESLCSRVELSIFTISKNHQELGR